MSSMNSPIKEGVYLTHRRFVQGLALSSAFASGADDPLLNNLMINQFKVGRQMVVIHWPGMLMPE